MRSFDSATASNAVSAVRNSTVLFLSSHFIGVDEAFEWSINPTLNRPYQIKYRKFFDYLFAFAAMST